MGGLELAPAFAYLDSISALYPRGISKALLASAVVQRKNAGEVKSSIKSRFLSDLACIDIKEDAKLLFVGSDTFPPTNALHQGPFSGENGALLQSIISKGMKLELKAVSLVLIAQKERNDLPLDKVNEISTLTARMIKEVKPQIILLFGALLHKIVLQTEEKLNFGEWHDLSGMRVMCTHSLHEIHAEPEKKREFWEHLKVLMCYAHTFCGVKVK